MSLLNQRELIQIFTRPQVQCKIVDSSFEPMLIQPKRAEGDDGYWEQEVGLGKCNRNTDNLLMKIGKVQIQLLFRSPHHTLEHLQKKT